MISEKSFSPSGFFSIYFMPSQPTTLVEYIRSLSRIWNDAAIAGSVFTGLSDPGRCQQEHIFSAGCYSGRGDMVGHTDIAFVDKIS